MGRTSAIVGILCCGVVWSRTADAKPRAALSAKRAAPSGQASAKQASSEKRAGSATRKHTAPTKPTPVRAAKKKSPPVERAAVRAHKDAAPTSYFLASNPHVPLAVVRGGAVRGALEHVDPRQRCGSKSRWAREGTSWNALDAWGKIVGTATIETVEDYDFTGCGEVYFAPKFDRTNTMLFVSADSTYVPGPKLEWAAPGHAQWKFKALLGKQATASKRKLPYTCSEVATPVRFFQAGATKLAVGGTDGALLIAAFDGSAWKTEHLAHGTAKTAVCYRPVSVLDMNGDGLPEVVIREVFGEGEGWSDVVRTRDANGHWAIVAVSPGGSTG